MSASGALTFKPKAGTADGTVGVISVRIKDSGADTAPNMNMSPAQIYTITISNP